MDIPDATTEKSSDGPKRRGVPPSVILYAMEPDDLVTAPPKGGSPYSDSVPAVVVKRLPDRRERDRSDGSILEFRRIRVRYEDGAEADWDDTWVNPR